MEIAQLVVTSLIALVGLYVANSFWRQQRLKVAEKRISAYRALWQVMEVSRLTRLYEAGGGPMKPAEAADLFKKMIHWYYASGNGMLFTQKTKSLYLVACSRLNGFAQGETDTADEASEGVRRMRELSMLRTQMVRDLEPFDAVYLADESDGQFLREAGLSPREWERRPWHKRIMRRPRI
jgi:hypothetical protein